MQTPTYEFQRIGNQYVPVRRDERATINRAMLCAGGAVLAYTGLKRPGLLRLLTIGAGAELIYRAATGRSLARLLSLDCCQQDRDSISSQGPSYQNDRGRRASQAPSDLVEEQSMESFPASDPPARTASVSAG